MRGPGLFTAHVPGTSFVHRMPLWLKLVGVLAVGAMPWVAPSVWSLALVTVALAGVVLLARLPVRRLLRSMRGLLPVLVLLLAFQWWSHDLAYAVRVVLGIVNAFVAAGVLTATTPVSDLLDGAVRAAQPLRRVVDPEVVALTLGVVVRSVPWVAGSFASVRESARARGLERDARAVVVPTVVHVVAFARATGEALAARGLTDPAEPAGPDDPDDPADDAPGPGWTGSA
ncbi:energy-coupling factor transporter transmembrane component T family protein [Terrabacter sp. C0L_2]|uniref:energy-coupling factor transporter transmembrane component T family protein n=1 Tax=Terrabacter sp. C0L_2 TaxID=3108389 RepID=UPI002ED508F6|nr:energy-coupling factor transporter transmembrane protein EcfT [Terrabacter sp. C0L_2]